MLMQAPSTIQLSSSFQDLVASIMVAYPKKIKVASVLASSSPAIGLQAYCQIYNNTNKYSSMTWDTPRVQVFKEAIHEAAHHHHASTFLEIGPGADLCLTSVILEAGAHTRVVAVEANDMAARYAQKKMRNWRNKKGDRVTLLSGLSSSSEVVGRVKEAAMVMGGGGFDVLVGELLGFFAGSEGAAFIMVRPMLTCYGASPVL